MSTCENKLSKEACSSKCDAIWVFSGAMFHHDFRVVMLSPSSGIVGHGHNQIDFRINYEDEKDKFKAWEKEMKHCNDDLNDDNAFKTKVDCRTDVECVYDGRCSMCQFKF